MAENNDKIAQLLEKLESLMQRQDGFWKEISELRGEINQLKSLQEKEAVEEKKKVNVDQPIAAEAKKETVASIYQAHKEKASKEQPEYSGVNIDTLPKAKTNFEKFIGENLINKIGIVITVIGVAIGAKYSIEHQLISPLTRIILGYLVGLCLLGFGIKLKKNYENYSAVLVSGAIAIMYLITYMAYSFYSLIPQEITFLLMVFFTVFTVIAAINYNLQVIAHIGLVGAYAVPFLLSDGSGRVAILFSYMSIINIGILVIAFKKYWKSLFYSSFIFSWLIFSSWFASKYNADEHFNLALLFISIFFVTFYTIFLAYKLLQKEKFNAGDILLLLSNSFIFFGFGYAILSNNTTGKELLGLFTLCNAIIHFGVSTIIYRQKLADRNLFFLVVGLVLVFITIAIPVQLDGNWVTLLWAIEAALLFWIGRTKNVPAYEILSYPLMLLSFISIGHDWFAITHYSKEQPGYWIFPFLNINFLTALLVVASYSFILFLSSSKKFVSSLSSKKELNSIITFSISAILLIVLYNSIRLEIATYWNQLYVDSTLEIKVDGQEYPNIYRNDALNYFKSIWIINYTLLFFSVLSIVNIKKFKNAALGYINLALNTLSIVIFLTIGLYILSELRDNYLHQTLSEYYHIGGFYIGIRYVSFAFVGLMLASCYVLINQNFIKSTSSKLVSAFDLLLYTSVLWILSSELIAWLDIMKSTQEYKLGLSILWGVYALLLTVLGIWKKLKHLRIFAIVLFGITLLKLFFYDISHLETIPKTIVFVSLGVLLLVISFLYNKYKHKIS
ncbi:MAG: DUF2339 domain-containing protein [Bacteroidales bacterium]|nr:DUF2339 domain-containing protein [Bacteroidales bacterium]